MPRRPVDRGAKATLIVDFVGMGGGAGKSTLCDRVMELLEAEGLPARRAPSRRRIDFYTVRRKRSIMGRGRTLSAMALLTFYTAMLAPSLALLHIRTLLMSVIMGSQPRIGVSDVISGIQGTGQRRSLLKKFAAIPGIHCFHDTHAARVLPKTLVLKTINEEASFREVAEITWAPYLLVLVEADEKAVFQRRMSRQGHFRSREDLGQGWFQRGLSELRTVKSVVQAGITAGQLKAQLFTVDNGTGASLEANARAVAAAVRSSWHRANGYKVKTSASRQMIHRR